MTNLVRYGVFLRPDPVTCTAVTTITGQLRAQFGLVSAGAFPPHLTLVGSVPLRGSELELVDILDRTLAPLTAVPVQNNGFGRLAASLVFDLHDLDGRPNEQLMALAATVDSAVRPLVDWSVTGLPPDLPGPRRWRGHLSLASHEMVERVDLRDELEDYIAGLDVSWPTTFTGEWVALYRLTDPSWSGSWWQTMRWDHVRSWRLSPPTTSTRSST